MGNDLPPFARHQLESANAAVLAWWNRKNSESLYAAAAAVMLNQRRVFVEGSDKSDPISLDTVSTTMTVPKEAGHARQAAEVDDSSW